jgi:hypothetical protein
MVNGIYQYLRAAALSAALGFVGFAMCSVRSRESRMDSLRGVNSDESPEMNEAGCPVCAAQDLITDLEDFIFDSSLNMTTTRQ